MTLSVIIEDNIGSIKFVSREVENILVGEPSSSGGFNLSRELSNTATLNDLINWAYCPLHRDAICPQWSTGPSPSQSAQGHPPHHLPRPRPVPAILLPHHQIHREGRHGQLCAKAWISSSIKISRRAGSSSYSEAQGYGRGQQEE